MELKIKFIGMDDTTEEMRREYIRLALEKHPNATKFFFRPNPNDPDDIIVDYSEYGVPFERIRRITGYLVGTLDRWNNSKQAEERDRVKHETRL